jgi:hypothetical protein
MYRRILTVILAIALLFVMACKQNDSSLTKDQADPGPVINEQIPDTDLDELKDKVLEEDPRPERESGNKETTEKEKDTVIESGDVLEEQTQPESDPEQSEKNVSGNTIEEQMQMAFDAGQGVWLVFSSDT